MADLTITSRGELQTWLEDKPREWAEVIALRAALRVLLFVLQPDTYRSETTRHALIFTCLRAIAVSSGARTVSLIDTEQAAALAAYDAAAVAAYDTAALAATRGTVSATADAAHAAAFSARTVAVAIGTAAATAASQAVAYTARAIASATAARSSIWPLVARDCALLADGEVSSDRLLTLHVWPDAPVWFVDSWERGRDWLCRSQDGFAIWAEWYERRIEGKSAFSGFDDEADNAFYRYLIDQDDVWWKREPTEVNRDIAAKVEELGGYTGGGSLSESEVRDILERTADPQAAVVDGKITIRANKDFGLGAGKPTASLANQLVDLARLLADGLEDNARGP
ncbi:hypothetical protein ABC955_14635 [Citromicrobium bathyomarinum]